jgi:hypothetical protein
MIRSGAGAYAKTLAEDGAAGVHCKPRPRLTLRGTRATLRAFAGHAPVATDPPEPEETRNEDD